MGKYDDIVNLPHYESKTHKHMSLYDRAAQFAPFAALTGYGEAINETGRIVESRRDLDESEKEYLNYQINILKEYANSLLQITIVYFVPDQKKSGGMYKSYSGVLKRIDEDNLEFIFKDKTKIKIENIVEIISDKFENIYD